MKKDKHKPLLIGELGIHTSTTRFDELPTVPRFIEYPMVLPLLRIENLNGVSIEMAKSLKRAGYLYLHELLPLTVEPRAAQTLAAASGLPIVDVAMLLNLASVAHKKLVDASSCLQGVRMVLLQDFDESTPPGMLPDDLPPLLDAAESLLMALLETFEDDEELPEQFDGVMPIFPIHVEPDGDPRKSNAMPLHPMQQSMFVMRTG